MIDRAAACCLMNCHDLYTNKVTRGKRPHARGTCAIMSDDIRQRYERLRRVGVHHSFVSISDARWCASLWRPSSRPAVCNCVSMRVIAHTGSQSYPSIRQEAITSLVSPVFYFMELASSSNMIVSASVCNHIIKKAVPLSRSLAHVGLVCMALFFIFIFWLVHSFVLPHNDVPFTTQILWSLIFSSLNSTIYPHRYSVAMVVIMAFH